MSKRVWIVGGSGVLGTALRALLTARGHSVCWTFNARPASDESPGGMQLDVRDVAAVERVAREASERLGGLDALVYLAAIGTTEPGRFIALDDVTVESWDEFSAVNLRGAFFATRAFSRVCVASGGNVVLAGSIDGHKPVPASVPYAATKGALEAMVRALSKDFGPKNIRVNTLAPGVLEGGLSSVLPKSLVDDYLSHDALSRKGTLREAAEVFAYFAVENTYVTGRSIAVDGGL